MDAADPTLLQLIARTAGVQLSAMLSDPETVRRMVAPGLVAAILGTGSAASLGLEEAYQSYAMRLAFNGAMALLFYVVPRWCRRRWRAWGCRRARARAFSVRLGSLQMLYPIVCRADSRSGAMPLLRDLL
jgi:hypothetical protein